MINMRFLILACLAFLCIQSINMAKVRSLRKHCVDAGFAGVCTSSTDSSKRGFCSSTIACAVKVNTTNFKQAFGNPPENSPCGNLKACLGKKCTTVAANPTVVGSTAGTACGPLVPVANKINPTQPPPLSP